MGMESRNPSNPFHPTPGGIKEQRRVKLHINEKKGNLNRIRKCSTRQQETREAK